MINKKADSYHSKLKKTAETAAEIKDKYSLAEFIEMWKDRDISLLEIRKKAWRLGVN